MWRASVEREEVVEEDSEPELVILVAAAACDSLVEAAGTLERPRALLPDPRH